MRENHFSKKMSDKTDIELQSIISDGSSYVEEARQAAIWELENRNLISDATVEATKILETEGNSEPRDQEDPTWTNQDKKYTTDDPNAPQLYSKRAITMFSALFSTIFGAALLMANLKQIGKQTTRLWVLIFGIGYTLLVITVLNSLTMSTSTLAVVFNLLGALILTELFWNNHIGKEFVHRKKKVWKPLIISIIITIPFILAMIYG